MIEYGLVHYGNCMLSPTAKYSYVSLMIHWFWKLEKTYFDFVINFSQKCVTPTLIAPSWYEWSSNAGIQHYKSFVLLCQCRVIGQQHLGISPQIIAFIGSLYHLNVLPIHGH